MTDPSERRTPRRWSATGIVTKTKQGVSVVLYLAGLLRVVETALALWSHLAG